MGVRLTVLNTIDGWFEAGFFDLDRPAGTALMYLKDIRTVMAVTVKLEKRHGALQLFGLTAHFLGCGSKLFGT